MTSMWATRPAMVCTKLGSTAPVVVETRAMFLTAVPPIDVKVPPKYAYEQSPPLNAIVSTWPLTFGSHVVTLPGLVAEKLAALLRV